MNNFKYIGSTPTFDLFFLFGWQAVLFEPILSALTIVTNFITVIYTDDEFSKRKNGLRLYWNHPSITSYSFGGNCYFVCKPFFENEFNTFNFYPISQSFPKVIVPEIVYFGEVNISNIDKSIEDFFYKKVYNNSESLIFPISPKVCQEIIELEKGKNHRFILFSDFQNLVRFEGVKFLSSKFQNLRLIGSDWDNYGINSEMTNHDPQFRRELYNGRICIDFGSKSGINSLFPRSIEIIESGGLLLQSYQPDSLDVLGEELCNLVTFKSFEELLFRINYFLDDIKSFEAAIKLYSIRFNSSVNSIENQLIKMTN